MKNIIFKYGLGIGLVLGIFVVVSMSQFSAESDPTTGEILGYSVMLISFSTMYFALRQFKTQHDHLNFKKAISITLRISLIATLLYSLSFTVYSELSGLNFGEIYMEMVVNDMENKGESTEAIEAQINEMTPFIEMYENPFFRFIVTCVEPLPVALIVSIFVSLMMRSRKSDLVGS